MSSRPLRCRLGLHAYVPAHPVDEKLHGPPAKVCRRCGRREWSLTQDVPTPFVG